MTFTKEELEGFAADYELFVERCDHVVEILRKLHYKWEEYNYECVDNWSIDPCGDLVEGQGGSYQYICFPSDFLTKTDEELVSVVEADERESVYGSAKRKKKRRG